MSRPDSLSRKPALKSQPFMHMLPEFPCRSTLVALVTGAFGLCSASADIFLDGGGLELVEEGGTFAPSNLAEGGTPLVSGELGVELALGFHLAANVNDGIYGNSNSWIGGSADFVPFAGVSLGATAMSIRSIAFGRDNLGQFTDRNLGLYVLQFTTVPNPDEFTPDQDWTDIGTLDYLSPGGNRFALPHVRHRFNFDEVTATGIRLITPPGTAIDEIELYADPGDVIEPEFVVITPEAGFTLAWDGNDGDSFDPVPPPDGAQVPDNLALAGTPIASSELGPELGIGFHIGPNLNDGIYGNANSWISASGDPFPFAGVALGGTFEISAIAFGRDNGNGAFDDSDAGTDACGGQCDDRSTGLYTIQVTEVADPDADTPDEDWTTVGTIELVGSLDFEPGGAVTSYFRHEFAVGLEGGEPITATGVRILVPAAGLGGGTAIDEIEVYAGEGPPPVLTPREEGGVIAESNLAGDGTPFAKDVIADGGLAPHQIAHLNDGVFGNANSWIGGTADSFAGISFGDTAVEVRSVAFGRDNTGGFGDRALGGYTIQFTAVPNPDETTPDGDWTTIGTVLYEAGSPANPALRHRFNFGSVMATGIRVLTPDGACIDELEIYPDTFIPPPPPAIELVPADGFSIAWDGNEGEHFDAVPPPDGAIVPDNLALAANGAAAFVSGELGLDLGIPYHLVENVNDGYYGNANSWISGAGDPLGFAGVAFEGLVTIDRIAWGRDNGNGAFDDSDPGTDACGGQCDDRSLGVYTLQITSVAMPDALTPDADWTTIGTVNYRRLEDAVPGEGFTPFLRHEFMVGDGDGAPLSATGVRIVVPMVGGTAIDEIEVYGVQMMLPFAITRIERDPGSGDVMIWWNEEPGKVYALDRSDDLGGWVEIGDGITSPTVVDEDPATLMRYYRVREL